MAVTADDVKYVKSKVVADTALNGGRMGAVEIPSGVRHALFPRVPKAERVAGLDTNGIGRLRKKFWYNENAVDDTAYGVLNWIATPSNAGDRFLIKKGTHTDTQEDIVNPAVGDVNLWLGVGELAVEVTGGDSQVTLDMEADDAVFENGAQLHVSDYMQLAQTVDAAVNPGDSVEFNVGLATWKKTSTTADIAYPLGLYMGDNKVLSSMDTTNEEWVTIAEKITTGEVVTTGDGTVTPILPALVNNTNGICQVKGKLPIITTEDAGSNPLVAYIRQDGTVDTALSDATAGELNMDTGAWTTDITWTTAPGAAKDIVAAYQERPYAYTGNQVVVELEATLANNYAVGKTFASNCISEDEVVAGISSYTETTVSGTFDEVGSPMVAHNVGAVQDTITLQFTSASVFSATGANLGALGTGFSIAADNTLVNPETGKNLLTIPSVGWGGTWAIGETVEIGITPSSIPIWVNEVVPAGTTQEPHNVAVFEWYNE